MAYPPLQGEGDRSPQASGGGGVPRTLRPEVARARSLRRSMTLPEVMLWQRLRGQPGGIRFRRQHPIGTYIADFYCARARLVVEVDGHIHAGASARMHDRGRDQFMRENGFRVVRVSAADVLRDVEAVAASIVAHAARPLHHQPSADGPPPRTGED